MTPRDARLQFRQWLLDHDLEPEVAHAVLESVPPFNWSQLVALEGRLSMRWMETTRIIVFALITLFLGIAGVSIGLAQG